MSEDYFLSEVFEMRLKREYEKLKGRYERLVDEVLYVLKQSIEKSAIKIHSLKPRETKIKTFDSFYMNVIRKQIKESQFDAVEDIAGVRIICLYRSDLEKLGNMISQVFDVIRVDTSRTQTESPFGYASDHYVVRLPKEYAGARYDKIKELKCEIQVRTILMDAWASVSHHLDYKQEIEIPRELRSDFNALAGVFHVADSHFQLFKEGIEKVRADLMKTVKQDAFNLDQEINYDSLAAYLKWKFPKRKPYNLLLDQHIVSELNDVGYQSIRQLDSKINIASPVLGQLEEEIFAKHRRKGWTGGGLIRACLDLTDDEYFKRNLPGVSRTRKERYRAKLKRTSTKNP